jgi:Flp pilus assembly protein CpaB
MNRRLLTILLISGLIAGGCCLLVYRVVVSRAVAAKPIVTTSVVAAATDIKVGTVITAQNLTTVEVKGTAPKGAILKPSDAIGRGVLENMYQGEPVIDSRLAPVGSGGGLAAIIPQGMRACAVKVDQVVGVAGFVTPGMRVDVLVSGVPPGQQDVSEGQITRTVLQNVQVISAGTDIQKDAEGKPQQVQVVNLLVTPEDAQILSLASNLKIQLVLRNPLDTKVEAVNRTATGQLFGAAAPAPQRTVGVRVRKVAAPKVFTVEVINGTKSSQEKFSSPEAKQ